MDLLSLAELLASPNAPLQETAASALKQLSSPQQQLSFCRLVEALAYDGLLSNVASGAEAIVGFYVAYRLSPFATASAATSSPVSTAASSSSSAAAVSPLQLQAASAMQAWLLQLDAALKQDTKALVQYNYRQTSKDKQRLARDAVATDGSRWRTAMKVFAIQCLLGTADASQSPAAIVAQPQAPLDALLEKGDAAFRVKLRELRALVVPEGNAGNITQTLTASLGGPGAVVALGSGSTAGAPPALAIGVLPCRPPPPVAVPFLGEIQYIAGSDLTITAFDGAAHHKDWAAARALVATAVAGKLTAADRDALTAMLGAKGGLDGSRLGLTPVIVATVAATDAEAAALLLLHLPKPSAALSVVVDVATGRTGKSGASTAASSAAVTPAATPTTQAAPAAMPPLAEIALANLGAILRLAPGAIEQGHMGAYISATCAAVNSLAAAKKTAEAQALVKSLATTLHQLVHVKAGHDNKEVIIPESKKDELSRTFTAFKSLDEIASQWPDMCSHHSEGQNGDGGN